MSIVIDSSRCTGCEECVAVCPTGAISVQQGHARLDWQRCLCCGACVRECFMEAVAIDDTEYKDTNRSV